MATAAVEIPSHNRLEPGSNPLQSAEYPVSNASPEIDAHKIASEWAKSLNTALSNQDYNSLQQLFLPGSFLGLSHFQRTSEDHLVPQILAPR